MFVLAETENFGEVFRPEHIHGDLNERLTAKCLRLLDEAKQSTHFELEAVLSNLTDRAELCVCV